MNVPLAMPDLSGNEFIYVKQVLESGVLSIGPMIKKFEEMICSLVGTRYACAVNSGTSALHLIIRAMGLKSGDEVITTPFSFIASSNCILFEDATPVFIDIDPFTLNMNIDEVEKKVNHKTKAILAVDVFGQPVDMIRLREIASKHHLFLIEDAAEAIGSAYNGNKAGSLADAAIFSFYPNKQITTAEGGIVVTNNGELAENMLSMRSQGRAETGQWLTHERLGYNYRLSELHAALGVAQMERIDEIISKRFNVAKQYNERLKSIQFLEIPKIHPLVTTMSWFVYVIRVESSIRDTLLQYLTDNGIGCKPYFTPIHTQSFYMSEYGYKRGIYPVTETAGDTCIAIPFFTNISDCEIDYVVETLSKFAPMNK